MTDDSPQSTVFDVGRQQVGSVYAKALLKAAQSAGVAGKIVDELESLVTDVLDRLPQLDAILSSPRIGSEEKERILDTAFRGRMTPLLLDGLKVVAQHGRLDCLREICTSARAQVNESLGKVAVKVTTADPVDEAMLGRIGQALSLALKSEVDVRSEIKPDLIGGLVVRVGDTVYDGSVSGKLDRLREKTVDRTTELFRGALDRFAEQG